MLIFRVQRLTGFSELCFEGIGGSYVQSHSKALYNYSVFKKKRSIILLCLQWVSLCLLTSFPLSSCFPVIWVCHQCKGLFWWSAYFWLSSIHKMSYAQSEVDEYQRLSSGYAYTGLCDTALGLHCSRIYAWCEGCEFIAGSCLSNRILWSCKNCKGVLFKYTALCWLIGITESIPSTVNLKLISIFYSFKKYL